VRLPAGESWVAHHRDELGQMLRPLRDDHAELGQVTTQRVDRLRALTDKQIASAEYDRRSLRLFAFDGYESHRRSLRGFRNCFGVGRIVLLPLDERLHIGRRNQFDRVAELADLAPPQ